MDPGLVPLAGGYSGETFLAESAGERTVVRIYAQRSRGRGPNAPDVDAAVLRLVRGLLPVPEVLEVRRANGATGTPGLLVTSFVAGERLDLVLSEAPAWLRQRIGGNLGGLLARLGQMPMLRTGSFVDGDLRIGPVPQGWGDLTEWVARHLDGTALGAWSAADRGALTELADRSQLLLDMVDRVCLVHSDFNPKNLLVDPTSGEITGLLDWEFAHAGSPYSDLGNLLRFERDPTLVDAVLSGYRGHVVAVPDNLRDLAGAADLFALVDLAARRDDNEIAHRAHDRLLAVARAGDVRPAAG